MHKNEEGVLDMMVHNLKAETFYGAAPNGAYGGRPLCRSTEHETHVEGSQKG